MANGNQQIQPFIFIILIVVFLFLYQNNSFSSVFSSSIPSSSEYYSSVSPFQPNFKENLKQLISRHESITYNEVWKAFETLDLNNFENCPYQIGDIYSNQCFNYGQKRIGGDQCWFRNNKNCYNREHSWPKSWWGSSQKLAAFTDLHHLFPTDVYVNKKRGNLPLGFVYKPNFTSSNGCKVGKCVNLPDSNCFEPANQFKGDFARVYFYMSLRYSDYRCCDQKGTRGFQIKPWMLKTLLEWHEVDKVSEKERKRNEGIYRIQGNRNPFIDHPEWVKIIFKN